MKKETLVATFLGLIMGGLIAFLIIFASRQEIIKNKKVIAPKISPTIEISNNLTSLEITSPKSDEVFTKNKINIKGKAPKDALIIVNSATTEKSFKNQDIDFSFDYTLTLGENNIKITSYFGKNIGEKFLKVYYIEKQ